MLCPFCLLHFTHVLVVHSGDQLFAWYIYCFVIYEWSPSFRAGNASETSRYVQADVSCSLPELIITLSHDLWTAVIFVPEST